MQNPIISIALPTPLRKHFDYSVDASMAQQLRLGMRVRVNFGHRDLIGFVASSPRSGTDQQTYKPILELLDHQAIVDSDLWALCKWAAKYYHHPFGEVLSAALPAALRKGLSPEADTEQRWQLSDMGKGLADDSLKRAPKQQQCINYIRTHGSASAKELAKHNITRQVLNTLTSKQLLTITTVRVCTPTRVANSSLALNNEQQHAYQQMQQQDTECRPTLLFGITGSGKTEVYLARIRDMINADKQVLVLVPEINLTPQFVSRFEQRLGISVAAVHSGMTDKQRLNSWIKAREGSLSVVIGTRSALFTPFAKLGLIVVDEEHATTLKQHEGFRYSARDCAVWRAQHLKIPLVLGSATPSLESYFNAQTNKYQLLTLTQRTQDASPPQWQLADFRGQAVHTGIGETALAAITTTIANNEQVLIFVNRLGYAPNLLCHDCSWHAQCVQCDANQTLHLQRQTLRCSHCDTHTAMPKQCPACNSTQLQTTGQGTEQVARYLGRYFDTTPVMRMDSETTKSAKNLRAQLAQINAGQACIIVGTQLMAKGHDFAKLSLVVVVNADDGLVSANYRALERTAQLLTQVGGRAGRSNHRGKVLIQTHYPEQPLFELLAKNDYRAIIDQELAIRKQLALPPISHEAQILAASSKPKNSEQCLQDLAKAYAWSSATIGPMPAILARKAAKFRTVLLFRATDRKVLHQNIKQAVIWLDQHAKKYQCRWSIDIDPAEHQ